MILNIENELITFKMMEEVSSKINSLTYVGFYAKNSIERPKRHFMNRFVKDYKQWALKYFDFVHYTIPMQTPTPERFEFPSEYCGQYGVYEAVRHLYAKDRELKGLL